MSAAASRPKPARVLLLGLSRPVLDTVVRELTELGLQVQGTTDPGRIAEDFDARDFDLLAIGGGVDPETRARVKTAFAERDPTIRLLDAHAPVAVRQILDRLSGADARPAVDLDTYLARIGYEGPLDVTIETLRELHSRHVAAITFEAIDALLGHGIDITPAAVDAKLIGAGRGGYCFEQNSLFARALTALGFTVKTVSGRVRWGMPAGAPTLGRTHMLLEVTLDGGPWLVDVGFGSVVPTAPLRIDTAEPQPTDHESYRVFPFGPELMVQAERDGVWLPLYIVSREPSLAADYAVANWYTSTSPDSHFTRSLVIARTTPQARATLLDNRFTIRRPDGSSERRLLDAAGIEAVLTDVFRLPVEPEWRAVIERAAQGST